MTAVKRPTFLLLFLLISFGSVCAVFFTPALPEISAYFGVTSEVAQLTITLFLVGYAVGQLLYGPLSNAYGRKKALYIGICLEIISSLGCILSAHLQMFWLLVLTRFLMAIGASVGLKMSFTLVADTCTPEESTKVISNLMIAFAITPGLGVALGGFLTEHLGWQSCFYFLSGYGAFLLYLTYLMSETATTLERNALNIRNILGKYSRKLKNKSLLLGAILMGCGTSFVYLFAALAPFIVMEKMHMSPSEYGLWNLIPPLGIIVGSQLSAYGSNKIGQIQAILLGIGIMVVGTSIMFFAFVMNMLFASFLFLPLTIIYIGMSFIFPNASTIAMKSVRDKSSGSAMMNFINMGIATISVLAIGFITNQSILLLPSIYAGLILFSFVIVFILFWETNNIRS